MRQGRLVQPWDRSSSLNIFPPAILAERLEFTGEQTPASDCASLTFMTEKLEPYYGDIRVMRDPTRGGLATTLIELAAAGGVDLLLEEKDIPVKPQVSAVADILGVTSTTCFGGKGPGDCQGRSG